MSICKRCKGNGFGNWRPQDGKCFECDGFGDMGIYQKWKEQRDKNALAREIEASKNIVSMLFDKLHNPIIKSERIIKARREEAQKHWDFLKEHNQTISLDEIKERAEKLKSQNNRPLI